MCVVLGTIARWSNGRVDGGVSLGSGPDDCLINCVNDDEMYSFHRGGSHLLFADGHVEFISASVEKRIILSALTYNQGD